MKQFTPVHGQFVTCEINGVKIKNARVSIATVGNVYICHNSRLLLDYKVINRLGFNHAYYIGYIGGGGLFFIAPEVKNLKPATPRKTKAEKVREARAKKKEEEYGYLPTLELSNDDINRLINQLNESINVIHDPYKELVEKVKEEVKRLESNNQTHLDLFYYEENKFAEKVLKHSIRNLNYLLLLIDQEEKKINKT